MSGHVECNPRPGMTTPISDWDAIDQASLESFPASDPPGRGSLLASPSASTVVPPELLEPVKRRPMARLAVGAMIAAIGVVGLIWRLRARRTGRRA